MTRVAVEGQAEGSWSGVAFLRKNYLDRDQVWSAPNGRRRAGDLFDATARQLFDRFLTTSLCSAA